MPSNMGFYLHGVIPSLIILILLVYINHPTFITKCCIFLCQIIFCIHWSSLERCVAM